jgi:glycerol-3-phosphate dehydrogenase (NAD(P)+)
MTARARPYARLAVLGGGAWGAALAAVAARAGTPVALWARRAEAAAALAARAPGAAGLPADAPLPPCVEVGADLDAALAGTGAALLAVPSQSLRDVAAAAHALAPPDAPFALCAKGVERGTGLLMSDVLAEAAPGRPVAVLSGPSFAAEVARDLPTAVVVASACAAGPAPEASVAARLAVSLAGPRFRPYLSDDIPGVEICGAVKNVIAIASGMADGAGFGENARAALVTRGLDEIRRLALALGGRPETVMGLAGAGDLMLTCAGASSRNFALGAALARGAPRPVGADGRPVTVEGEANALAVTDLARRLGVEMPIAEAVRAVLHEGEGFGVAFARLWARPLRAEADAGLRLSRP